jgi:hypothetical protein
LAAHRLDQALIALLFIPPVIYFARRFSNFSLNPMLVTTYQRLLPYTYAPINNPSNLSPADPTAVISGEELSAHDVSDINRRLFLKLIGTAGLTTFLFALFTKSSQAAFFGSMPGPGTVSLKDTHGNKIDPAEKEPTDGYEIAEVDDSAIPAYYGFLNKEGAWYIAREGNGGEYRYYRGSANFGDSWATRESFTYDYFNNVF